MIKLLACSVLLAASSAFAAAGAPTLAGQWSIHQNIAGNESDQSCAFVVAGNKITGSCKVNGNEVQLSGSLDGTRATWKYEMDYNGSTLTMIYTATLDDSGKIAGNVEVQPYGVTGDFTATPSREAGRQ
jgi:hypothetical protein